VIPIAPGFLFVDIDPTELRWVPGMGVIPTDNLSIRVSVFQTTAHRSLARSTEPHGCATRFKLSRVSVFSREDHCVGPSLRIFQNSSGEQANRFVWVRTRRLIPDELKHLNVHVGEESIVIANPNFERAIIRPWAQQVISSAGPCSDFYVCHGAFMFSSVEI
jgi:hypothetical protein